MMDKVSRFYQWALDMGDPRTEPWLLVATPWPVATIIVVYLIMVMAGPRLMRPYSAFSLRIPIILYNLALVILSLYMFHEFLVSSVKAGYSYSCQPVDYSNDPLALRMASVCWWYFFSKIIEITDTIFFILRKKNSHISFLHVYHHCTMIVNWWLGVKYIAGGQSWFLAMLNCAVHVVMYSYYMLAALQIDQRYLWWKKYLTRLQLAQFVAVIIHTSVNLMTDCAYPRAFNYAVVLYSFSLIALFSNFYVKAYRTKAHTPKHEANGMHLDNGEKSQINSFHNANGVHHRKRPEAVH